MNLINALTGTASQVNSGELSAEFSPILIDGEEITGAFKVIRDLFVFTQVRLIIADKQGVSGKKVEYLTIPYRCISKFSVETAGFLDRDSELKIWMSGDPSPIKKEFGKGTNIVELQKLLAHYLLRS